MEIINSFVVLLSGLALYMVGIKQMSSGLEKISSSKMQSGLSKMSNNRFASFGFGTFITSIMQSSTLVTVMTISFLNANLLTLFQGIAIVIGANVGTTITAIISSFATFDFAIFLSLFILAGVLIDMFAKKKKYRNLIPILVGFGLIFMGLSFAAGSFKSETMRNYISAIFVAIDFPLLLILVTIIFTAIVHSSSLVVGIAIILVSSGTIPLEYAFFIILGANIGTTLTGVIASLSGNANAKRLAFIQLIFNVTGSFFFTIFIWLFTDQTVALFKNIEPNFQAATFHLIFNVSTAIIALIFIKQLEKLSHHVIKDHGDKHQKSGLFYVDESMLKTPTFAFAALNMEVQRMFYLTKENLSLALRMVAEGKVVEKNNFNENEESINFLNYSISLYLVKLSSSRLSEKDEMEIGKLYHLINDLERIGDHAHNFALIIKDLEEDNSEFTENATKELVDMGNQIMDMFNLATLIYEQKLINRLNDLSMLEYIVDKNKASYEDNHIERLRSGECKIEHSRYFYEVTSQLERIGDHLINIGYTVINMVGDENENEVKPRKLK